MRTAISPRFAIRIFLNIKGEGILARAPVALAYSERSASLP
jgi:hypothetical protein